MFPAAFDYVRAGSVDETTALLAEHGFDARVLAGGQSLIPAMRYRLARPTVVVDINRLAGLDHIREENGHLAVGALARDSALERSAEVSARYSLLKETSDVVADPVVRHLGTVVGSICHCDPSGDWGTAALASRAFMVVRGPGGERVVSIDDFLVDSFTTSLDEGEMAIEVRFPTPDARTAGAYSKIERKVGDFATAAAAVQVSVGEDGRIAAAGIALAAAGPKPMRIDLAEAALVGNAPSSDVIRAAGEAARAASQPSPDGRGSVEYKQDMARVLVERGLRRAFARLGAEVGS